MAASTVDDKRACYSNPGSIAAPGGNGGFQDVDRNGLPDDVDASGTVEDVEYCLPQNVLCTDGQCTTGVISVVTMGTSTTGYAYWSGSSFSTALVSGLVATGISNGCVATGIRAKLLTAAAPANIPATEPDAGSLGAGIAQASFTCP